MHTWAGGEVVLYWHVSHLPFCSVSERRRRSVPGAPVVAPDGSDFWLEVSQLYSRQQLHPGQDLRHRGGQREPVRQVMIATRSAFECFSSLVWWAHASLVESWR